MEVAVVVVVVVGCLLLVLRLLEAPDTLEMMRGGRGRTDGLMKGEE